MESSCILSSPICSKSTYLTTPSFTPFSSTPYHHRRHVILRATGPTNNDGDKVTTAAETPPPPAIKIRYRPRSRNQARRQQEEEKQPPPPRVEKKEWEEMTVGEKALELYVGEKGLLFWLNKLAYASIFAIIGGWILFRFIGPTLGLYQLDTPPLPPTAIFKGSGAP